MEPQRLKASTIKETDTASLLEAGKTSPRWGRPRSWSPALFPMLLFACFMGVLYLFIVVLAPLPQLHLSTTPLAEAWPWTLALSRVFFPQAWTSTANSSSLVSWLYPALLTLILVALLTIYSLATWCVYRWRNKMNSAALPWLMLLLTAAALFCLILLFQPALFSDDVFTYIFSGRLLAFYHADPLNNAPIQFPLDSYLQWVVSGRFTENFYGPLWLYIASGLVSIGGGPVVTLFLFKGVAVLTHLVNCMLVWAILTRLAPARRLPGTLLYAWNPLAIIELAGSGHSEGLLLSILLLATLIYIRGKGRWHEIAVLALFGLAISMNLVVLLFAPLFTWFIVRTERNGYRAFWGFCWRTLVGLGLLIPLFLPLWRGPSTFFSITSAIDVTNFSHSLVGLIEGPLEWIFGLVDQWLHFPPVMQPLTSADSALRASTIFIFALIYFRLFGKVRAAPMLTGADSETLVPGFDVLLDCWSIAVFWYLVLVLGWFWPWYALWILWIVVLRPLDSRTIAILLLSGTALLFYPFQSITGSVAALYQPILVFGIPLVYMFVSRKKRKARTEHVG